jgi:hypothetical protein
MNQQEFEEWIQEQKPNFAKKFNNFVDREDLSFENYSTLTEAQWERYLGTVGAVIFNQLHPSKK